MTTAFVRSLLRVLFLASPVVGLPSPSLPGSDGGAQWGPLATSGRWIQDASGAHVHFAGVNWPGHAEVMIPEGLQYQSVAAIVANIKSLGMNVIRLTYAIQMVDEIYARGLDDVPLQQAFVQALGRDAGTTVLNRVLAKNPDFSAKTTRLQVFDAVAAECAKQNIYVHLDNHMSTGTWCCSNTDGNGFWGDEYFPVTNWTRGLSYMASHGKTWPNLASMSLRNEPRMPTLDKESYTWENWYANVRLGAAAIHGAHADVLVFVSGLNYDGYLTPVVRGTALTPGTGRWNTGDFGPGLADKLVLELHNYDGGATSCDGLMASLDEDGLQALDSGAPNTFPVVMSEWGFAQDATTWQGVYASCLASKLPAQKVGWMIWVLAGSYYVRSGTKDFDEAWGLLTHDWSTWRSPKFVNGALMDMVAKTVSQ